VNDPQRANKYAIRLAHDLRGPCPEVQQLTVNVLSEMGILPATLQPSLALFPPSTDHEPPTGAIDPHNAFGRSLVQPHLKAHAAGGAGGDFAPNASGWASDGGGGVVASVELSWTAERGTAAQWHPARLERLASYTRWSFVWGHLPWQLLHGELPSAGARLQLRVADDSGNIAQLDSGATI